MAMTANRHQQMLDSQSALAQKIFLTVPIQEHWHTSSIYGSLRNAGTAADTRAVRRCLVELKDAGLIREPVSGHFQRVTPKTTLRRTKEQDMPKEALTVVPGTKKIEPGALDVLASLSGEVISLVEDISQRMRKLAIRIEEVALSVEAEREGNAERLENFKQLQSLLKSLQGEH
ncbi:hypothetical protein NVV94_18165 [Pseudomonas sp. LS1212]|uniref:hypothetical protein n=1 Tax=Pseudomonas sp. LS1212 TaxID=2972478 RepID=UPI00215BC0A6|nr:hypothetical protein [Pseudomonas sp. LS1212]UVJ42539.1 hypothetical protein NVV94_18165 [Pseudomonas sp. LS1212]